MKKNDFNEWLTRRVQMQHKVTIGGCAAMAALGLLAFVFQGGFLFLMLNWGYGTAIAVISLIAIFGGMGIYTCLTAPKTLCDQRHTVHVDGRDVSLRIAPTMASAWTFALGSLDSEQSVPERIFGLMMMVPRMLWTSWYVFGRVAEVRAINVPECGKVLRLLLKKAERVDVPDIAEKFSSMDVPTILRQVSLIDGVVFLTKGTVGLSLANRFRDDLEKGLSLIEETSSPF